MSEGTSAGTCSDYLGLYRCCSLLRQWLIVCDKKLWVLVIAKEQRSKTLVVLAQVWASASRLDVTMHVLNKVKYLINCDTNIILVTVDKQVTQLQNPNAVYRIVVDVGNGCLLIYL